MRHRPTGDAVDASSALPCPHPRRVFSECRRRIRAPVSADASVESQRGAATATTFWVDCQRPLLLLLRARRGRRPVAGDAATSLWGGCVGSAHRRPRSQQLQRNTLQVARRVSEGAASSLGGSGDGSLNLLSRRSAGAMTRATDRKRHPGNNLRPKYCASVGHVSVHGRNCHAGRTHAFRRDAPFGSVDGPS